MSVRALKCPKCATAVNVPATVMNVRCPACATIFAAASGAATAAPASSTDAALRAAAGPEDNRDENEQDSGNGMMIAAFAGGVVFLALLGLFGVWLLPTGKSDAASGADAKPELPQASESELAALVVVDVPEEQRKRIYDAVRANARTSVEKPLMIPEGNKVRESMEKMLQDQYDNNLRQLAALHDLDVEKIQQIVVEGDLKNWDPRPRSNARRGGKRVYPEERSKGFKGKGPIL